MESKLKILMGDITKCEVDAIVNAANTSLLGGGGVDGAIHRAAGKELLKACEKLNGCSTGLSKITKGYKLPAKYIIHTVGPVWRDGKHGEPEYLASCYKTCLQLASEFKIQSIAFPAISCGIYHFPIKLACEIAVSECLKYLNEHNDIKQIYFVCFTQEIYEAYENLI